MAKRKGMTVAELCKRLADEDQAAEVVVHDPIYGFLGVRTVRGLGDTDGEIKVLLL